MIEGETVILIEPFPVENWESLYEWLNCCAVVCESDSFPADREHFRANLRESLPGMRSWAVYRTRERHELIGALIFEPIGTMGGRTYVASRRSVWGRGFMDEAGRLAIDEVFSSNPELEYIIGMVVENNYPARSYNERLGLHLKNVLTNFTSRAGASRDMRVYEMTREQWTKLPSRSKALAS